MRVVPLLAYNHTHQVVVVTPTFIDFSLHVVVTVNVVSTLFGHHEFCLVDASSINVSGIITHSSKSILDNT